MQFIYRGAGKSLARPGRKQARKHVRDARYFNNIETRAVSKFFFFLQGKAPKEIHAILTETLACFVPGRAKDLSAPLYLMCVLLCDVTAEKEKCSLAQPFILLLKIYRTRHVTCFGLSTFSHLQV